jgi:hypothetical protein
MQTLTSAGGHFEFSNGANSNNTIAESGVKTPKIKNKSTLMSC